ncbi:hypothetical protein FQN54_003141 [Arachnomyces sp. PD_36]|nr:hypothetical protein FQN54_003141 [Arachnomyces sp. PD_36]
MASLNLSTNGPSITKSYRSVVDAPPPSGPASSSPTYGQWAVFSVSTPLVNAFQQDAAGKDSVLKVQSTGEGELVDLIEDFSEGRIQFAYVKVRDPNTGLPKNVLVGWCGEGVPERTKGYFTSHLAAVSKFLHGYHVQITARSDSDLTPEGIVQKVADSSGSKYSGDTPSASTSSTPKPPVKAKPAFNPTRTLGGAASTPLVDPRRAVSKGQNVDEDGWGDDAPPVTRTQLEKVQPAYQPTKVNMRELSSTPQPSSTYQGRQPDADEGREGVVKGGYQPIGKVDIAAIRRQAQQEGSTKDDRPEPVKGSYEPVGKVDIGAIRARAQKPSDRPEPTPSSQSDEPARGEPTSYAAPERLTTLPKPKVSNRFGGGSTFTGTKAPVPGGFEAKPPPPAAPVGTASRTFADSAGKTPAQLWAEKKAREGGAPPPVSSTPASQDKPSGGEWKSSYAGKSWAPVQTTHTGKSAGSNIEQQSTGDREQPQAEESQVPSEGIGSIRDRFAQAPPPMSNTQPSGAAPPPLDISSKPNAGRGIQDSHEEERRIPSPPPQPRSPTPPTPQSVRASSPIRVAMPVGRGSADENVTDAHAEQFSPPTSLPVRSLDQAVPDESRLEDDANHPVAQTDVPPPSNDIRAVVQFDYEKAEDNEIELKEGEYVTEIDMVDEDWWVGVNEKGEKGLFPGSFVEVLDGDGGAGAAHEQAYEQEHETSAQAGNGPTATALYDYEAGEDNEISFPEDAQIVNIEFPDDDWWSGEYNGRQGFFPANYVQLNQ